MPPTAANPQAVRRRGRSARRSPRGRTAAEARTRPCREPSCRSQWPRAEPAPVARQDRKPNRRRRVAKRSPAELGFALAMARRPAAVLCETAENSSPNVKLHRPANRCNRFLRREPAAASDSGMGSTACPRGHADSTSGVKPWANGIDPWISSPARAGRDRKSRISARRGAQSGSGHKRCGSEERMRRAPRRIQARPGETALEFIVAPLRGLFEPCRQAAPARLITCRGTIIVQARNDSFLKARPPRRSAVEVISNPGVRRESGLASPSHSPKLGRTPSRKCSPSRCTSFLCLSRGRSCCWWFWYRWPGDRRRSCSRTASSSSWYFRLLKLHGDFIQVLHVVLHFSFSFFLRAVLPFTQVWRNAGGKSITSREKI